MPGEGTFLCEEGNDFFVIMQPNSGNIFVGCFIRVFAFIYLLTFWIRGSAILLIHFICLYYSEKHTRFLRHKLPSGTGDSEIPMSRLAGTYSWWFSLAVFVSQVNYFIQLLKISLPSFFAKLFPHLPPSYSSIEQTYDSYVKFSHGCSTSQVTTSALSSCPSYSELFSKL